VRLGAPRLWASRIAATPPATPSRPRIRKCRSNAVPDSWRPGTARPRMRSRRGPLPEHGAQGANPPSPAPGTTERTAIRGADAPHVGGQRSQGNPVTVASITKGVPMDQTPPATCWPTGTGWPRKNGGSRGGQHRRGDATGVPNPAAPSMNAPKAKAITGLQALVAGQAPMEILNDLEFSRLDVIR